MVPSSRPFGETFCRSSGSSLAVRLPVLADSGSECLNRPSARFTAAGQLRTCTGFPFNAGCGIASGNKTWQRYDKD